MKRKISSDLTKVFQIVFLLKFVVLSIIFLIALFFISGFKVFLMMVFFWIIGLLTLKQIGIMKLKAVFWSENFLSIENQSSYKEIPVSNIKEIKRTFLFDDFPYKIIYVESEKNKKVYFLPKTKFFQHFFSENELIAELRKEIKKSNTNV